MRITELFGKSDIVKQWNWDIVTKNSSISYFTVGDTLYKFAAYQDPDEDPGSWEIEFSAEESQSRYGVTGSGRSAEVFSTVVDILKDFINKKGNLIRRLKFSAKEGSRQDLYARMVKRLLPDWTFDQDGEEFILTRPNLTWWVYSVEPPYNKIPAVKITSASADKAKELVMIDSNSLFKGANPMGIVSSVNKPRR